MWTQLYITTRLIKMSWWNLISIYVVSVVTVATASIMHSARLQPYSKQMYCDIINSYVMLDFLGCASKCLIDMDDCEGVSIRKSPSRSTCHVCLVKAVRSPMKRFTTPSNDTRIYRRVIDMEKGKTVNLTSYMTMTMKIVLLSWIT